MPTKKLKITIIKNGPYHVTGNVPLTEKIITPHGGGYKYLQGKEFPQTEEYLLCRCGHSKNPPYCDGSHINMPFDGTETASREKYARRARRQRGPDLILMDDNRCAFARFCHRDAGDAWELTARSQNPHLREEAIIAASECPAGRLVACDRDGNPIEPVLEPAVEILQDPAQGVSGPIYVKGNIPVESAQGEPYEIRNRLTLCRCGKSRNKPFCDASHVSSRYRDKK